MRNVLFLSIGVAALGLTPLLSKAKGDVVDTITDNVMHACNGCTLTQIETNAEALGRGDHYYYDLNGNHLYYLDVECEPDGGGEQCYASTITPDPSVTTDFNSYHSAWESNGLSEAFHDELGGYNLTSSEGSTHDDGYVNAFDTIYNPSMLNTVLNDLLNPSTYPSTDPNKLALVAILASPQPSNATFTVTLTFHDHSKREFKLDVVNRRFGAIADTAVDASGNILPESRPAGGREYDFHNVNDYDPNNVSWLLTGTPEGVPQPLKCTWDGEKLTCYVNQ